MNQFYVYGLVDPRNNSIFYIGKGKGKRVLQHEKEKLRLQSNTEKLKIIQQIKDDGYEVGHIFICENLSEESALLLERILIHRIGRKVFDEGTLINLVPGGKWNKNDSHFILESDIPDIETIDLKYPEFIPILEKYPHTAKNFLDSNFYENNEYKIIFRYNKYSGSCTEWNIDDILKSIGYQAGVELIKELRNNSDSVLFVDGFWSKFKIHELRNIDKIPYEYFDIIDFNFVKEVNDALLKKEDVLLRGLYPNGKTRTEFLIDTNKKIVNFQYFFSNGIKKHLTENIEENSNKKFFFWYPTGILKEETIHISNNYVSRNYYSPIGNLEKSDTTDGKIRTFRNWYENGSIRDEAIYEYSESKFLNSNISYPTYYESLKLIEKEYSENGSLIKEKYTFYPYGMQKNESVSGYEKTYFETGEIESEIDYSNGVNNKIVKTYNKEGEVFINNIN